MAAPANSKRGSLIDPNKGEDLRTFYETLRAQLETDRATYVPKWTDLEAFFAPGTARWNPDDMPDGSRKDYSLINETGLLALRTLKAGMLTGMSSQTRPWFKIVAADLDIADLRDVRAWCEHAEDVVRGVFIKSNFYESLLTLYGDEGLYGTGAFLLLPDDKTTIRCHPYPIGSYYLACDDALRLDLSMRVLSMTARQIVERFGIENVSPSVATNYENDAGGQKENRFPVVHVIHRGNYFGQPGMTPAAPWWSVWYEQGDFKPSVGVLRRASFNENPLICGRWNVVGEDVYGRGAADDCLGSCMSLQSWEERTAEAVEKQIKPPMLADASIDPRKLTVLPGDISFIEGTKDGEFGFKPAYTVDFRIDGAMAFIQRIEGRINDAMYRSLFQMFSESDRRDITAEEIRARAAEKMQVLGPVVERNIGEVLGPSVARTLQICLRAGLLRKMPDVMAKRPVKLEFVSILALAQKLGSLNNLTTFVSFAGSQAAIDPTILDTIDMDKMVRKYAELADLPADLMRTPEEVEGIRNNRNRQAQAAQMADNAQKLAAAGKNMAQTPLGTGSLLDNALPALAGGAE